MYIHERSEWPRFTWDLNEIAILLASLRHRQGRLTGRMLGLGFDLQGEAILHTLTQDVIKTSEIEGENLNADQVRSSVARRLGMDIGGLIATDRHIEGMVDMLLDATRNYGQELNEERLFGWHAAMFPTGRSGLQKITVGAWRTPEKGAMQVVSGATGREKVHFEAPAAERVPEEMDLFFSWFESGENIDPVLKAAVAHLWFVTIHPFDDGNGRIARAITDLQLARSDDNGLRFYSMSAQIQRERKQYYEILEQTQKGNLDITPWLHWFISCLNRALVQAEETLNGVLNKAAYWNFLRSRSINERQKTMLNKLFDGFDGKLNTSKWAKITKVSTDTALRDIQNLEEQGILRKQEGGGRSTSYELVVI